MRKLSQWLGIMIAAAFCLSGTAFADGGYSVSLTANDQDASAAMGSQQAFLVHDDTAVTLYLQSSVQGSLRDFAWILPLPATPLNVAEAPRKLFDLLDDLTAPRFVMKKSDSYGGGGCFGGGESAGMAEDDYGDLLENERADGVTILKAGVVGDFSYEIVQAESGDDLTSWLATNNYQVSDALASLADSYVADGFVFLAAKVRREVSDTLSALPALALTFPADTSLLFPMRITALSGEKAVPVVLYVASKGKLPILTPGKGYEQLVDVNSGACSLKELTTHLDSALKNADGHLALQFREPLLMQTVAPPNNAYYYDAAYSFWGFADGVVSRPVRQTNRFQESSDNTYSLQTGTGSYTYSRYDEDAYLWSLKLSDYGDDVAAIMQPLFGASFPSAYVLARFYGTLRAADMTQDIRFSAWDTAPTIDSDGTTDYLNSYVVRWEGGECPHMSDDGCREAPKPFLWLLLGLLAFLPRYRREV